VFIRGHLSWLVERLKYNFSDNRNSRGLLRNDVILLKPVWLLKLSWPGVPNWALLSVLNASARNSRSFFSTMVNRLKMDESRSMALQGRIICRRRAALCPLLGLQCAARRFRGIKPNSFDKIVLSFEPSTEFAIVNAISVEDEAP